MIIELWWLFYVLLYQPFFGVKIWKIATLKNVTLTVQCVSLVGRPLLCESMTCTIDKNPPQFSGLVLPSICSVSMARQTNVKRKPDKVTIFWILGDTFLSWIITGLDINWLLMEKNLFGILSMNEDIKKDMLCHVVFIQRGLLNI